MTYQDLRKDRNLKDQTVIVVRAPSETKLEVPDPQEVGHQGFCFFNTLCDVTVVLLFLQALTFILSSTGITGAPDQHEGPDRSVTVS